VQKPFACVIIELYPRRGKKMEPRIIVVDASVSLKPYLDAAVESAELEAHMERMGLELVEAGPGHKIGFLEAMKRTNS
jgi:hypothetical protein